MEALTTPRPSLLQRVAGATAPVDRRLYASTGFGLMALKYAGECALSLALTGQLLSPLVFLSPSLTMRSLRLAKRPPAPRKIFGSPRRPSRDFIWFLNSPLGMKLASFENVLNRIAKSVAAGRDKLAAPRIEEAELAELESRPPADDPAVFDQES